MNSNKSHLTPACNIKLVRRGVGNDRFGTKVRSLHPLGNNIDEDISFPRGGESWVVYITDTGDEKLNRIIFNTVADELKKIPDYTYRNQSFKPWDVSDNELAMEFILEKTGHTKLDIKTVKEVADNIYKRFDEICKKNNIINLHNVPLFEAHRPMSSNMICTPDGENLSTKTGFDRGTSYQLDKALKALQLDYQEAILCEQFIDKAKISATHIDSVLSNKSSGIAEQFAEQKSRIDKEKNDILHS